MLLSNKLQSFIFAADGVPTRLQYFVCLRQVLNNEISLMLINIVKQYYKYRNHCCSLNY